MNAFLITHHQRPQFVNTWIKIIRSFESEYYILVADNGKGHYKFLKADEVVKIPNARTKVLGDSQLMDAGMKRLMKRQDIEFVVKTSADTWLFKEAKLLELFNFLEQSDKHFLSSNWEHPHDIACDFFIVRHSFIRKIFPLNYEKWDPRGRSCPEILFGRKLVKNLSFYHWREREPIHYIPRNREGRRIRRKSRKFNWPKLGLVTSHDFQENIRTIVKECPEFSSILAPPKKKKE